MRPVITLMNMEREVDTLETDVSNLSFPFLSVLSILHGHDNVEMDTTRGHVANS